MRSAAVLLQVIIAILGTGTVIFLLWEPHLEGRNANAGFFETYFQDPFLAYVYIASIPFFIALYKAFQFFGHVRKGRAISRESVKTLRTIKFCFLSLIPLVLLGEVLILISESDDRAGGVAMGVFVLCTSLVIAALSSILENILQEVANLTSKPGSYKP